MVQKQSHHLAVTMLCREIYEREGATRFSYWLVRGVAAAEQASDSAAIASPDRLDHRTVQFVHIGHLPFVVSFRGTAAARYGGNTEGYEYSTT